MESVTSYVGVGSNLGDALHNVSAALAALHHLPQTKLHSHSSLFRSAPIDATGDDFINAVARVDSQLSAESLLAELQKIELSFGRKRPFRNAPRTLDLDLLLYGDVKIATDILVVPHPRMTTRAFVILPLLELNPDVAIPGYGQASRYVQAISDQVVHVVPKN
ncbi:MAG: 2-amino-4-hydroxy-6-hydroxymethyldihydropteridine diphosphokinase [Sulfuritalea sp.]|jgi:2-amino-4-hydroxy-6-hydroxymethyldihydropteridine diphosphokinase|nr:2-amino-4-hydroxy-6-hydroxymethyldihydropteridine diphosphokinase [Polynucleobacter sp.]MCF8187606.1 2-amino-4-hydroxy-6-hydroxymethyldihydropteridine diphosphokinase [Sulfuritalea sp.]